tara:strand:+ start:481 stop:768 length:288 start_codon:yes stop_codon:yes gene_type:complete
MCDVDDGSNTLCTTLWIDKTNSWYAVTPDDAFRVLQCDEVQAYDPCRSEWRMVCRLPSPVPDALRVRCTGVRAYQLRLSVEFHLDVHGTIDDRRD